MTSGGAQGTAAGAEAVSLDSPIGALAGIGPKRSLLLSNLGISSIRDLLYHLPRDYQDRRKITPIAEVEEGDLCTVEAEVTASRMVRMRRRMSMAVVTVRDETGEMNATWFGRGFLAGSLKPDTRVLLTGVAGQYKGLALKNPDYEILTGESDDVLNTGRIVPIYRLTEKITQRMLRAWISLALETFADELEDPLPRELRKKRKFPRIGEAIKIVHFPDELNAVKPARRRFAYEELFQIQLDVLRIRARRLHKTKGQVHDVQGPLLGQFRRSLPFEMTQAQGRAVDDLLEDMRAPRPMGRLLQGDVGCGKTVVALHAVAAAADGGFQTALMAPTEVLAEQHFLTLRRALEPLGIRVVLLTGVTGRTAATRKSVASGDAQVVIGTHALIQEKTTFDRLGLVIVDEQHRFGVMQRLRLAKKGSNPDILHMTATPIPRTLSLTVYGAMDLTVIDEMPPGRSPVETRALSRKDAGTAYAHVIEEAGRSRQAYIICPFVEESESREARAVIEHFRELSSGTFKHLSTGLLHGRVKSEEKEAIMQRFADGDLDVLFSTTVVEVGVDVPNATTIAIEESDRFGLTQLHQLRGRVGRGKTKSTCFLVGDPTTEEAKRRAEIMCRTTDGFEIAEEDLKLRGPGELYGVRQSGAGNLRVADLVRDARLLDLARRDAQKVMSQRQ